MITVKNAIYFLLSFALVLLGLDLFLRVSYIENTSPTDFTQTYGRCRVKDRTFVHFNEGFGIGRFNAGRYLGAYYPEEKPEGVIRIAALGDSYVEAFQVFERDHFLRTAETRLNQIHSDAVQILNFGRSGFDFGDMYAYYQRMVKPYHCDMVLFFLSNEDLHIRQTDPLVPKVVVDETSRVQVTNAKMPEKTLNRYLMQKPLAHNSTVFNMMNKSRKLFFAGEWKTKFFGKFYGMLVARDDVLVHQGQKENHVSVSPLSYALLENLKDEGPEMILVNRGKTDLDEAFTGAIPPPIKYLNLRKTSKIYDHQGDPHYWPITQKSGHWNVGAHERIGQFLASELQRMNNEMVSRGVAQEMKFTTKITKDTKEFF
jgi:hypothetical protein